jgi:hypothetical protein
VVVITTSELALGSWLGPLTANVGDDTSAVTSPAGAAPSPKGSGLTTSAWPAACWMQAITLRDVVTHPGGLGVLGELVH